MVLLQATGTSRQRPIAPAYLTIANAFVLA
jgi:hypothetical protein